jgi:ABC-type sugar transport system ATPase subunit
MSGNTAFVEALCAAIEQAGARALPLYVASLRAPEPERLDALRGVDAVVPTVLAAGGTRPDKEHEPVGEVEIEPVRHGGTARLGARVRPGWFVQTHEHPELLGRTLLEILHRGDEHRAGMPREEASRALDRYELAHAAEQRFESLSGGQQARFQILLLELSGATLLLLDEPTDNLDVQSAEALEEGLEAFEGTVVAVTHDRWFARGFDRFLVYGADGSVYESDGPVWDEGRVERVR